MNTTFFERLNLIELTIFKKFFKNLREILKRLFYKKKITKIYLSIKKKAIKDEDKEVKPVKTDQESFQKIETIKIINTQAEKKPYRKKTPIELGKPIEKKKIEFKVLDVFKPKEIIKKDVGKRHPKPRKPTIKKNLKFPTIDKKSKKFQTRRSIPYVKLNFSKFEINLVIPIQILKLNSPAKEFTYHIQINEVKFKKLVVIRPLEGNFYQTEKIEIEIEQPLKKWEVSFPEEFRKSTIEQYSYHHKDTDLYLFSGRKKNQARLIRLWDKGGNFNIIPKKKIWALHSDSYLLESDPILSEDLWIWEYHNPIFIDLRNKSYISLKHKKTGEIKKYPCDYGFYLEGTRTESDDTDEEYPLFTGNKISINSPRIDRQGWVVWLQPHNKKISSYIVKKNWKGKKPIELQCPEDLNVIEGIFQIDICTKSNRIPIETLYFRYIPYLKCKYPRDLIIPDENGHKNEIIDLYLYETDDNWNILTESDVKIIEEGQNNHYQIIMPVKQDYINFSLTRDKDKNKKIDFEISIPRLKWRMRRQKTWMDKAIEVKRSSLNLGIDFDLEVNTNDYNRSYKIATKLFSGEKMIPIQEARLIMRENFYYCHLNQFFDTILTNYDRLTLSLVIYDKTNNKTHVINYVKFAEKDPIQNLYKYLIELQDLSKEGIKQAYRTYCFNFNDNKDFSLGDLFDVLSLSFNPLVSIKVPSKIFKIISQFNDKFKRGFIRSIVGLFKNVILNLGNSGIEVKNREDYLNFLINFETYFEIIPPSSQEILEMILKKSKSRINDIYLYFNRVYNIFNPDIQNFNTILKKNFLNQLKNSIQILKKANEEMLSNNYYKSCSLSFNSAYHMLKSYLFIKRIYPLDQPNLTISKMYLIAFEEVLKYSKYFENFKNLGKINLDQKHAQYAYKYAEKIYKKIKSNYSFLDTEKKILKKKTELVRFELRFPRNNIPDAIKEYIKEDSKQKIKELGLGFEKFNFRYDHDEIIIFGLKKKN